MSEVSYDTAKNLADRLGVPALLELWEFSRNYAWGYKPLEVFYSLTDLTEAVTDWPQPSKAFPFGTKELELLGLACIEWRDKAAQQAEFIEALIELEMAE